MRARPRSTVHLLLTALVATALALVGLLLATPGAQAADVELVANGGLESGNHLAPWVCTAGSGQGATGQAHSGSYALKATPSGSDNAQCTQSVTVKPSSTYVLSAWVLGPYVYLGATGTGSTDPSTWTSSTGWTKLSTTFTTGASTSQVTVYLHGWYGQSAYLADDISLVGPGTPSPTPSTSVTVTPSPSPSTSTSPSPSSSPSPSPSPSPSTSQPPGKHLLTGYWQNFDNGATVQRISDVPAAYDIIAVSFADATGTPGGISFTLDSALASKLGGYTAAQFKADIAAKRAAGKKVIVSVGGQNGTVAVNSSASATTFANTAYAVIQEYGFNGIDIDLENGVNATYMGQALNSLAGKVGSGFVLTMAPQTIDMQSAGAEYFKLALNVKSVLTIVNMQYYNSGAMLGCDGNVYSQGTVNFLTALACIQLKNGLEPRQVGLGVPASTSAAGGGYVSPSVVNAALDCLAQGTNCGSFKPDTKWPGIGGAMTWSTNWDAKAGGGIANTVGGHLHAMP
ncbi:glycosyl hydrolase family 18 protein [Kitasatospora sp. NPDC002040]|uniref:chitinase n=1 Tax=Kitasatospora sp. NPDC002040 TaxID=3154661 RepID=UPI00331CD55A